MNTIIRNILCVAVMIAAMPLQLLAQVNTTDVSTLDYAVYIPAVEAEPGETVTLSVCLKNVNAIATWQSDLTLPEGVSIATDDYGDPMVVMSTARTSTSRHSVTTRTLSSGAERILCSSASNKTFTGTDGETVVITLNISPDIEAGEYAITLKNEVMSEADQTSHKVSEAVSKLTIGGGAQETNPYDLNKDGKVDISDVTHLVNYILTHK